MPEWRPILDFNNYEISEDGNVRRATSGPSTVVGKILKPSLDNHGYYIVSLCKNRRRHTKTIHRLVAEAFIGLSPYVGAQVAHGDGSRTNNHWTNLRWCSVAENQADRVSHGTDPKGVRHPMAKVKDADIREIRSLYKDGVTQTKIGNKFGLSQAHISKILLGQAWSHVT